MNALCPFSGSKFSQATRIAMIDWLRKSLLIQREYTMYLRWLAAESEKDLALRPFLLSSDSATLRKKISRRNASLSPAIAITPRPSRRHFSPSHPDSRRHRCRSSSSNNPTTPCRLASSSGSSCEHNGARIHLGQPYHPPASATLLFLRISVEQRRGIIPFSCASTILLSIYFPPFSFPGSREDPNSRGSPLASSLLSPSPPLPLLLLLPFLVLLFLLSRSRSFFALASVSSRANLLRHL